MHIIANGKEVEIEDAITILQFLESKGINPFAVVVEHNGEIPSKEQWRKVGLQQGDRLEIVKMIGGG